MYDTWKMNTLLCEKDIIKNQLITPVLLKDTSQQTLCDKIKLFSWSTLLSHDNSKTKQTSEYCICFLSKHTLWLEFLWNAFLNVHKQILFQQDVCMKGFNS